MKSMIKSVQTGVSAREFIPEFRIGAPSGKPQGKGGTRRIVYNRGSGYTSVASSAFHCGFSSVAEPRRLRVNRDDDGGVRFRRYRARRWAHPRDHSKGIYHPSRDFAPFLDQYRNRCTDRGSAGVHLAPDFYCIPGASIDSASLCISGALFARRMLYPAQGVAPAPDEVWKDRPDRNCIDILRHRNGNWACRNGLRLLGVGMDGDRYSGEHFDSGLGPPAVETFGSGTDPRNIRHFAIRRQHCAV